MSIELEPVGFTPTGNWIRNTVAEILRFARLDLSIVQDYEVNDAICFAADEVVFRSPEDDSTRSLRAEPMRKRAEANLATAELYERISTHLGISTSPKQILTTLGISIGTDFPTPTDYITAFAKVADRYRENGLRILRMLQPVTASIESGIPIDE